MSVARDMVELAPDARAGAYVLVHEDGKITYDMAGHERAYVLWGLQKMILLLMSDGEES